ncbi:putative leucine-rich repeat-containing, plant-type, leucine-rich repeat domain, L [Medicago truncatula]|uniref:Putative leucine-rich repeat-containing, plant-type, leucine-rich repeat domain, L n=1 Tax=Medicago truncatula TaxID=3880 RepID=A0A396HYE9_MEDTR|nr:putative leucine-rich repeat-containing, plant-type, leucine-rich repeat domain, L [Medicago truncatula]
MLLVSGSCIEKERHALLELKSGLVLDDTYLLPSWDTKSDDCCAWEGIGCRNQTGHVEILDLNSDQFGPFEGDRVAAFKVFEPQLESVHLMGEEFQRILLVFRTCNILIFQTMALRVQSLINLEISLICSTLILVQMILWEPFFVHLEVFQICRNFILDTIKDSVYFGGEWLSNLTLLTHLDLSYLPNLNSSHVWLQMIGKLPKIQELKLSGCDLSDLYILSLSRSLLNFSTSLATLDLSQNAFSSSKIYE